MQVASQEETETSRQKCSCSFCSTSCASPFSPHCLSVKLHKNTEPFPQAPKFKATFWKHPCAWALGFLLPSGPIILPNATMAVRKMLSFQWGHVRHPNKEKANWWRGFSRKSEAGVVISVSQTGQAPRGRTGKSLKLPFPGSVWRCPCDTEGP